MNRIGSLTDEQLDNAIGAILRVGVIVATIFVLSGGIGYLLRAGEARPEFAVFRGEPHRLKSGLAIIRGAVSLDWSEWIQFGLIVLIATPVIRVLFSILAFGARRDFTYVAITLIVAGALIYSLFGVF